MSARLNMNPIRYETWKGKTLNQIVSFVQKNQNGHEPTKKQIFKALPLKIHRRELLVSNDDTHIHNPRTSITINSIDQPNGTLVTESQRCGYGSQLNLDVPLNSNKSTNGLCNNADVCIAQNAKRRVRSSGMIRKQYDQSKNNAQNYYSDNKQYLTSRNKTYQQNIYAFIRAGEASLADQNVKSNLFSPAGLTYCQKASILADGNNNFFSYIWIDDTYAIDPDNSDARLPDQEYEVHFSSGYYNLDDLNQRIQKVMEEKGHYIMNKNTYAKTYFIKFIYNTIQDKIELQIFPYSTTLYPSDQYTIPRINNIQAWTPPISATLPAVRFINNEISRVTGFSPGYYPDVTPWFSTIDEPSLTGIPVKTDVPYWSFPDNKFFIYPMYKSISYKPSNNRFDNQGAVSSSTHILRERFDTITTNGSLFVEPLGKEVGNAMAYGVSEYVYTKKDKLGYPLRRTPVFSKYSDTVITTCSTRKNMFNG
jgi:hypothetical protein